MAIELEKPKKKVTTAKKILSSILPQAAPKSYVVIDFPLEGDKIQPHQYTVRIGAGGGAEAALSIDGGEWKPARESAGYYWVDWHNIPAGKHKLTARIRLPNGKFKKSKAVTCTVQ